MNKPLAINTLFGGMEAGVTARSPFVGYASQNHPYEVWEQIPSNSDSDGDTFRIARKEGGTKTPVYRRYTEVFATLQDAQRALNEVLRGEVEALRGPALREFTIEMEDHFIPDWSVSVRLYQGAVTLETPRVWEVVLRESPAEHPEAAELIYEQLAAEPACAWHGRGDLYNILGEDLPGLTAQEPFYLAPPKPRRGWFARLTGK